MKKTARCTGVHESRDVVAVKDNINMGQPPTNSRIITSAHVHGDRIEFLCLLGELFDEGLDLFFTPAFNGMQDSSILDIDKNGHVFMALSQAELINSKVFDFMQGNRPVEQREPLFVDLFDKIPAHCEVLRDRTDGAKLQKIQSCECERPYITVFTIHKGQSGPPKMSTPQAFESVEKRVMNARTREQKTMVAPFPPPIFTPFSSSTIATVSYLSLWEAESLPHKSTTVILCKCRCSASRLPENT